MAAGRPKKPINHTSKKMIQQYGKWKVVEPEGRELKNNNNENVFFVQDTEVPDGELYVLKIAKKNKPADYLKPEIKTALSFNHPNVLKVIDHDLNFKVPYMVTEYCRLGNLQHVNVDNWNIHERRECFHKICAGMAYIQSRGFIKNVSPPNIFIKEDKTPVIGDLERVARVDNMNKNDLQNQLAQAMIRLAEQFWGLLAGRSFHEAYAEEMKLSKEIINLTEQLEETKKRKVKLFGGAVED